MGEWLYYNFAAGSFHNKKLCSRLYSNEIEFYFQKSLFKPPFGERRSNVRTPLWLIRKPMVDFLFVIIRPPDIVYRQSYILPWILLLSFFFFLSSATHGTR